MASPKPPIEIKRTTVTPDSVALYEATSRSKPGKVHHPVVDLRNGRVDCGCEWFEMRLRPQAKALGIHVHIASSQFHCSHIKLAVADCIRRGDIKVSNE